MSCCCLLYKTVSPGIQMSNAPSFKMTRVQFVHMYNISLCAASKLTPGATRLQQAPGVIPPEQF